MHRLFILFLIALLPLRGWTVERMGVDMGPTVAAVAMVASPEQPVSAQGMAFMSAECAQHMQMALQADGADASGSTGHEPVHKGCQNCQLCMPLAALEAAATLLLAPAPQVRPRVHSMAFASAEAARLAKPPIS